MREIDKCDWNEVVTFQVFHKLSLTGYWNEECESALRWQIWTSSGWEAASWVAPSNWSILTNEVVSS